MQFNLPWAWLGGLCLGVLLVLILVLYFRGVFRDRIIPFRVKNIPGPGEGRFPLTIASVSNSVVTQGEVTGFWAEVEAIQSARLQAIRSAHTSIQFETFFVTPGQRANDFAAAIVEQAEAGVEVQLIIDAQGAKSMPQAYWQHLRAAGVEIRFFNPFDWKAPVDYLARTHRKLLLVDGKVALVGGAGVSDDWDGKAELGDTAPWLDFEIRYQGSVVASLAGVFFDHWTDLGGVADLSSQTINPTPEGQSTFLVTPEEDPTYRSSSMRSLFNALITAAQERLWLASPYLLPDRETRRLLAQACQRGVDVRILTTGPKSDKKYVYDASCQLYDQLLAAGIELYEYQPSMMHAKVVLIDRHWVSAGSANFDPRSFFHNDELNLSTNQPDLVERIEQFFDTGFSKSQFVTRHQRQPRSWWERLRGRLVLFFQWHL